MGAVKTVASQEKVRRIAIKDLGDKYEVYRFPDPKLESGLKSSLSRHGQLAPIVVCHEDSQYQVLDGFKRLRACQGLPLMAYLEAKVIRAGAGEGKAAMLRFNQERKGLSMVEEGLIIRAMCREEGLSQQAVAGMVNHHPSWVCRRLGLSERLHDDVVRHMKLGLIKGSLGRELEKLPRGKQPLVLAPIERHRLNFRETAQLVGKLLGEENLTAETVEACVQAVIKAKTTSKDEGRQGGPKSPPNLRQMLMRLETDCLDVLAFIERCPLNTPLMAPSLQLSVVSACEAAERVVDILRKGEKTS